MMVPEAIPLSQLLLLAIFNETPYKSEYEIAQYMPSDELRRIKYKQLTQKNIRLDNQPYVFYMDAFSHPFF